MVCAASKSWGFSQVEALFRRIQRTLDHEADDEMAMKELSEQVAEELGMTCTADHLRELFGVEWHLRTRILREDYTKRYVLRKEILEALEKHHPEQAHVYFQALFFHYELDTRQSMVLLGFSNGEQELVPRPPPDDEEFMLRHVFSWQEICSSRSLGIVGVDMMRLLPEEEMALKAMVDEARRERDNLSVETCKTWMRQMAAWKRRQQQVEER